MPDRIDELYLLMTKKKEAGELGNIPTPEKFRETLSSPEKARKQYDSYREVLPDVFGGNNFDEWYPTIKKKKVTKHSEDSSKPYLEPKSASSGSSVVPAAVKPEIGDDSFIATKEQDLRVKEDLFKSYEPKIDELNAALQPYNELAKANGGALPPEEFAKYQQIYNESRKLSNDYKLAYSGYQQAFKDYKGSIDKYNSDVKANQKETEAQKAKRLKEEKAKIEKLGETNPLGRIKLYNQTIGNITQKIPYLVEEYNKAEQAGNQAAMQQIKLEIDKSQANIDYMTKAIEGQKKLASLSQPDTIGNTLSTAIDMAAGTVFSGVNFLDEFMVSLSPFQLSDKAKKEIKELDEKSPIRRPSDVVAKAGKEILKEANKAEEERRVNMPYNGGVYAALKEGNIGDAVSNAGHAFTVSLPTSLLMANPISGSMAAAGMAQENVDEKIAENGKATTTDYLVGGLKASTEYVFENMLGTGRQLKELVNQIGRDGASELVERALKGGLKDYAKKLGLNVTEESFGEGLTELTQNAIDIADGKDIDLFEGVPDATLIGLFGGMTQGTAMTTISHYVDRSKIKSAQEKRVKAQQLNEQAVEAESPVVAEAIEEKAVKLNEEADAEIEEQNQIGQNASPEIVEEIQIQNKKLDELEVALETAEPEVVEVIEAKIEEVNKDLDGLVKKAQIEALQNLKIREEEESTAIDLTQYLSGNKPVEDAAPIAETPKGEILETEAVEATKPEESPVFDDKNLTKAEVDKSIDKLKGITEKIVKSNAAYNAIKGFDNSFNGYIEWVKNNKERLGYKGSAIGFLSNLQENDESGSTKLLQEFVNSEDFKKINEATPTKEVAPAKEPTEDSVEGTSDTQKTLDDAEYKPRSDRNVIVRLPIDKVLKIQEVGENVARGQNGVDSRIDKIKQFLKGKPKKLEASLLNINKDNSLGIDGRHRLEAAKEMGATHAMFEIKKSDEQSLRDLLNEPQEIKAEATAKEQEPLTKEVVEYDGIDYEVHHENGKVSFITKPNDPKKLLGPPELIKGVKQAYEREYVPQVEEQEVVVKEQKKYVVLPFVNKKASIDKAYEVDETSDELENDNLVLSQKEFEEYKKQEERSFEFTKDAIKKLDKHKKVSEVLANHLGVDKSLISQAKTGSTYFTYTDSETGKQYKVRVADHSTGKSEPFDKKQFLIETLTINPDSKNPIKDLEELLSETTASENKEDEQVQPIEDKVVTEDSSEDSGKNPEAEAQAVSEKGAEVSKTTQIGGYKFTDTPSLKEKNGLKVKAIDKSDLGVIKLQMFVEGSKNIPQKGTTNEGGGWYSATTGIGSAKVLYNVNTDEAVEIDSKNGITNSMAIGDFVKNNPREAAEDVESQPEHPIIKQIELGKYDMEEIYRMKDPDVLRSIIKAGETNPKIKAELMAYGAQLNKEVYSGIQYLERHPEKIEKWVPEAKSKTEQTKKPKTWRDFINYNRTQELGGIVDFSKEKIESEIEKLKTKQQRGEKVNKQNIWDLQELLDAHNKAEAENNPKVESPKKEVRKKVVAMAASKASGKTISEWKKEALDLVDKSINAIINANTDIQENREMLAKGDIDFSYAIDDNVPQVLRDAGIELNDKDKIVIPTPNGALYVTPSTLFTIRKEIAKLSDSKAVSNDNTRIKGKASTKVDAEVASYEFYEPESVQDAKDELDISNEVLANAKKSGNKKLIELAQVQVDFYKDWYENFDAKMEAYAESMARYEASEKARERLEAIKADKNVAKLYSENSDAFNEANIGGSEDLWDFLRAIGVEETPAKATPEIMGHVFAKAAMDKYKHSYMTYLASLADRKRDIPKLTARSSSKTRDNAWSATRYNEKLSELRDMANKYEKEATKIFNELSKLETNSDKAIRFLDRLKIRAQGKALGVLPPFAIPIGIWNAAIDTIILSIKANKLVSEAIEDGIKYLRSRNVSATDQELRSHLSQKLGVSQPAPVVSFSNGEFSIGEPQAVETPPTPPIEPTPTPEGEEKRLIKRVMESNLPQSVKDKVEANGLYYEIEKHEEAFEYAKWLFENNGYEPSLKYAQGAVKTFLSGMEIDRLAEEANNATSTQEKEMAESGLAAAYKSMDESLRAAGREISAVYHWYLNNSAGIEYVAKKVADKKSESVLSPENLTKSEKPQTKINELKSNLDKKKSESTAKAATKATANKPAPKKQKSDAVVTKKSEYEKAKADLKNLWASMRNLGALTTPEKEAEKWVEMDKVLYRFAKTFAAYKGAQLSDFVKEVSEMLGSIPDQIDLSRVYTRAKDTIEAEAKIEKTLNTLTIEGARQMAAEVAKLEEDIRLEAQKVSNLKSKEDIAIREMVSAEALKRIQNEAAEVAKNLEELRSKKSEIISGIMKGEMESQAYNEYVRSILLGSDDIRASGVEDFKSKLRAKLVDMGVYRPEQYVNDFVEAREKYFSEFAENELDRSFKSTKDKILGKINRPAKKRQIEKMSNDILYGALNDKEFTKLFYAKYGLVDMDTPEMKAKLKEFSENIRNAANQFYKEREMARFQGFLNHIKNRENKLTNYGLSYFYNNILLHYDTFSKAIEWNLGSSLFNGLLMGIKNPANSKLYFKTMFGKNGKGFNQSVELWKASMDNKVDVRNDINHNDFPIDFSDYDGKAAWFHKFTSLSRRILGGLDNIFSTRASEAKLKELIIDDLRANLNKVGISMPKNELNAAVNEIMGHTANIAESVYQQSLEETAKQFNTTIDNLTRAQLNDARMLALYKLNQRVDSEYEKFVGEKGLKDLISNDHIGILKERANKWAKKSVLFGTPEGTAGFLATWISQPGKAMPWTRPFFATIVNAPFNIANFMIDGSPIGLVRASIRTARGKKGIGLMESWAKKNNIDMNLTPDEKKEMWIKVGVAQAVTIGLIGLMGGFGDDDDQEKLKEQWENGSWRDEPIYITGDLTGNYADNEQLKATKGGAGINEYTLYVYGRPIMMYGNSPFGLGLIQSGLYMDAIRSGRINTDNEWYEKLILAQFQMVKYIKEIGSFQSISKVLDVAFGTGKYHNTELTIKQRAIDEFEKGLGKTLTSGGFPAGRAIQSFEEDMRGLMGYDKREAVNTVQYLEKMFMLNQMLPYKTDLFGRPIKENFKMESPLAIPFVRQTPNGEVLFSMEQAEQSDPYLNMLSRFGINQADKYYRNRSIYSESGFSGAEKDKNGIHSIDMNQEQMNELNRIRGEYFKSVLDSPYEKGSSMSVLQYLSGLDPSKKEAVNDIVNEILNKGRYVAMDRMFGVKNPFVKKPK